MTEQELERSILNRPHIFILGAGASLATIPNGDKYGKQCPVMNGFVKQAGLEDILSDVKLSTTSDNLEEIFSELDSRLDCIGVKKRLECALFEYFKPLVLPDEPTIYDFLLLSLRSKDYVFSFNWDDLLIQAYNRVYQISSDLPQVHFLHGNVNAAFCPHCKIGLKATNKKCFKCGGPLEQVPLLFPVKNKNYNSHPYIKGAWDLFLEKLPQASILTIFGYSAPKSDSAAIDAMRQAFSMNGTLIKYYDNIEIIDIKPREEIYTSWEPFIETVHDHVQIYSSIHDTLIGEFPRRSVEGYVKRNYQRWWGESNHQFQGQNNFKEFEYFFNILIERENNGDFNVI